jgi:hypothetical protein
MPRDALLRHIAQAQADARAWQGSGSPHLATLRQLDAEALRRRLSLLATPSEENPTP